jgi:hypothetical protein
MQTVILGLAFGSSGRSTIGAGAGTGREGGFETIDSIGGKLYIRALPPHPQPLSRGIA